jgi:hypothetical protein
MSAPDFCTVTGTAYAGGAAAPYAVLLVTQLAGVANRPEGGALVSGRTRAVWADGSGLYSFPVLRGAPFRIRFEAGRLDAVGYAPDESTASMDDVGLSTWVGDQAAQEALLAVPDARVPRP